MIAWQKKKKKKTYITHSINLNLVAISIPTQGIQILVFFVHDYDNIFDYTSRFLWLATRVSYIVVLLWLLQDGEAARVLWGYFEATALHCAMQ